VARYLADRVDGIAVVVGHSFGGRVALHVASRALPHIAGLVLMAVPGLPAPPWSRARLRRAANRLLRRTLTAVRPVTGPRPLAWHTDTFGSRDYRAAGVLRPILVRTVNEDLTAHARAVTCPTLLLYGDEDVETPPDLGRRYQTLMGTRAALVVLPHKDHFLYNGTGAHLCGFLIRRWLPDVG
jgi:pimeloyl-ACP methyl ester carboxylesterase